ATGVIVVEFTSEPSVRRAWETIEKDAEQLVAAARVTRTDYHAPFRARLYPSLSSGDKRSTTAAAAAAAAAVAGAEGDVRENWDSS
ncbi:unnamed protein product, partial [Laminaria digitata]